VGAGGGAQFLLEQLVVGTTHCMAYGTAGVTRMSYNPAGQRAFYAYTL